MDFFDLMKDATHFAVWCSFCRSQEAGAGTLSFDIDGQPVDLPVCQDCLDKARAAGKIEDDN